MLLRFCEIMGGIIVIRYANIVDKKHITTFKSSFVGILTRFTRIIL